MEMRNEKMMFSDVAVERRGTGCVKWDEAG